MTADGTKRSAACKWTCVAHAIRLDSMVRMGSLKISEWPLMIDWYIIESTAPSGGGVAKVAK